jgi:hypothetical protein
MKRPLFDASLSSIVRRVEIHALLGVLITTALAINVCHAPTTREAVSASASIP